MCDNDRGKELKKGRVSQITEKEGETGRKKEGEKERGRNICRTCYVFFSMFCPENVDRIKYMISFLVR